MASYSSVSHTKPVDNKVVSESTGYSPPSPKRVKLNSSETEQVVSQGISELKTNAMLEDMCMESQQIIQEVWVTLNVSWSGKSHVIEIAESDRVLDLKDKLNGLTSVPPERQKILGLVKGRLPPDEASIRDLKLVNGKKFSLVGTPVGKELQSRPEDAPDVLNDLDIDVSQYPTLMREFANDQRNIRLVKEATAKLDLHIMNEPREGKALLVLDLDYTLIDTKPLTSGALPPTECARPGLHAFLEAVYPYYDICIWSQTSWIWLETKLVELEMVGVDRCYKISFVLDSRPMFKVVSKREGKPFVHSVKPLKVIWNKFPQWNAHNTLHIDDLSRNFALNPLCGIKIHAFHKAHTEEAQHDRELTLLRHYLVHAAANFSDFTELDNRVWRQTAKILAKRAAAAVNGPVSVVPKSTDTNSGSAAPPGPSSSS